ncbi:MAG: hypothetical protein KDK39_12670 [Leptospiraceae bacterium]|nr:hypothetical protein [Leptospiraceae bacterium]
MKTCGTHATRSTRSGLHFGSVRWLGIMLVAWLGLSAACTADLPEFDPRSLLVVISGQSNRDSRTTDSSSSSPTGGGTSVASPLKSIQSGLINMSGQTINNVPIAAVDWTKAFSYCTYHLNTAQPQYIPICRLSSNTNLEIKSFAAAPTSNVEYYVVEFQSGAYVTRGTQPIAAADTSVNINPGYTFDLTKSFVLVETNANSNLSSVDEQLTMTANLNGSTNILLQRNENGTDLQLNWQVVQLDGASVQSLSTNINAATSRSVAISSVNVDQSFVILNARAGGAANGNDAEWMTRARLTANTVELNRGASTNQVDLQLYVVQLGGATVQQGTQTTPNAATTSMSAFPANSYTSSQAVPFISTTVNSASQQHIEANWTSQINTSQIDFIRVSSNVTSSIDWQLVQFAQ